MVINKYLTYLVTSWCVVLWVVLVFAWLWERDLHFEVGKPILACLNETRYRTGSYGRVNAQDSTFRSSHGTNFYMY